jgi:uncharacterized protein (DUF58 family)
MKRKNAHRTGYFKLKTSGILFLSGAFFVLISAWNTGNNLLYLVLGMMVSLTGVSFGFLRITVSRLAIERSFPLTVYAGEPAEFVTRVRNNKRMFHSFALQIDADRRNGARGGYILKIAPGETMTVATMRTFSTRGLYPLTPTRLSTSYPFGFFEYGILCNGTREILVYPEVKRLRESVLDRVLSRGEMVSRGGRGSGTEYYSLREYSHGDDARLISWKVSAKHGKLMLREFEKPERKAMVLVLDTDCAGHDKSGFADLFEEAVKFCASLAWHCIESNYDVQLLMPDESVADGSGERHLHNTMRSLALVKPSRGTYETLLQHMFRLDQKGKNIVSVVVTPEKGRFGSYSRGSRVSIIEFDRVNFD